MTSDTVMSDFAKRLVLADEKQKRAYDEYADATDRYQKRRAEADQIAKSISANAIRQTVAIPVDGKVVIVRTSDDDGDCSVEYEIINLVK